MRTLRVGGCSLVLWLALFSFASAQTMEDDDPNDQRYWGYSSGYSQMQNLGATPVAELPIPVLGVELSDLTKNFGDPRGGGTRTHQGLDIMAKEGTPIVSPTDAVVVRTGNGVNSGLYIRTANPGGENFVYMHLSAIAPGIETQDFVKRGEIIGFVGNTGNASGGPAHLHFELRVGRSATDPFPRLTKEFTTLERDQSITDAQTKGIVISQTILEAWKAPGTTPALATGERPFKTTLAFGETSSDIVTLQKFLIAAEEGIAAAKLKAAGATGYFGSVTKAALIEYQTAAELKPTGVVDEKTFALVFSQEAGESSAVIVNATSTATSVAATFMFTRDLELGMKGADVRELQKFLNANGFLIAETGDGSPGNETQYFGSLTRAALAKYQAAKGITPAAGYLGPKTRAAFALR